jgi:hypothetical protein
MDDSTTPLNGHTPGDASNKVNTMTNITHGDSGQFKLFAPDGRLIGSGSMSAVTEHILDSKIRADAVELLHDAAKALGLIEQQREEEQELRERQVHAFCDGVARLARRLDILEAQREEQMRADEEAEERRIEQFLDELPDPDSPDPFAPSGDLHVIAASGPEDREQLQSDQGTLPPELKKGAPPDLGTEPELDPSKLAYPETPAQRAPVAVSMMSEDD